MKTHGLTLIELIITLVIIMIITVLAVPNIKNFSNKSKTDAIVSQLLQAIHFTRSIAMVNNQMTTLCGSENFKTCSTYWHEGYIVLTPEKIYFTFRHIAHDGFLYWRAFPKGRNDVEFLPDGRLNAENGTFWYCVAKDKNPLFAILISQRGRPRVIFPDAKGEVTMDSGEVLSCII